MSRRSERRELGEGLDVWKVGVFVDETPAAIEAVMRAAHLDVAQIYGGDAAAGHSSLESVPRVGRCRGSCGGGRRSVSARRRQRTASSFDWQLARGAAEKVIVAGGLDASNVAEAIRIAEPWGVDASSKLESAPGIKDHEKVRAVRQGCAGGNMITSQPDATGHFGPYGGRFVPKC